MQRVFPIVTLMLSLFILLVNFAPYPGSDESSFFLMIPLSFVAILWSILLLRRVVAGYGSLITPVALYVLPVSCLVFYVHHRTGVTFAIISFCVVVFNSIQDFRNRF